MGRELKLRTASAGETESLGEKIGSQLKGGEMIELIGDIGAGKTTFVKGLARGAGSTDKVSSPTFTVNQVYRGGNISIRHYDFYRITDFEIIKNEIKEALEDSRNTVVLEWPEAIGDGLPSDHIKIRLSATGENERAASITLPDKYENIGQDL